MGDLKKLGLRVFYEDQGEHLVEIGLDAQGKRVWEKDSQLASDDNKKWDQVTRVEFYSKGVLSLALECAPGGSSVLIGSEFPLGPRKFRVVAEVPLLLSGGNTLTSSRIDLEVATLKFYLALDVFDSKGEIFLEKVVGDLPRTSAEEKEDIKLSELDLVVTNDSIWDGKTLGVIPGGVLEQIFDRGAATLTGLRQQYYPTKKGDSLRMRLAADKTHGGKVFLEFERGNMRPHPSHDQAGWLPQGLRLDWEGEPLSIFQRQRPEKLGRHKRATDHAAHWDFELRNVVSNAPLKAWNRFVTDSIAKGIETNQNGNTLSWCPWFSNAKEKKPVWKTVFRITDNSPQDWSAGDRDDGNFWSFDTEFIGLVLAAKIYVEVRTPATREAGGRPWGSVNASAEDEGLRFSLETWYDDPKKKRQFDSQVWMFAWTLRRAASLDIDHQVIAGGLGLKFDFTKKYDSSFPEDHERNRHVANWRLRCRFEERELAVPGAGGRKPVFEIKAQLPLTTIMPMAQDPVPNENLSVLEATVERPSKQEDALRRLFRRDPAVVIPLDANAEQKFLLDIEEESNGTAARNLRMTISRPDSPGVFSLRSLVVDQQPLTITRVDMPVDDDSAAGDNVLAVWRISELEGSKWEFSGMRENGCKIAIPPQVIGEEMYKGEEYGHQMAVEDPPGTWTQKTVQYRHSPPAVFVLLPSYFNQRFMEAGWNIRRVLGYPGQRAPGARIKRMEFELLYGLTCIFEADKAPEMPLQMAEIASRLGAVRQFLPALPRDQKFPDPKVAKVFEEFRGRWGDLFRIIQSRLGIWEPWHDFQRRTDLLLTDGIRYAFRESARLEYPLRKALVDEANPKRWEKAFHKSVRLLGTLSASDAPATWDKALDDLASGDDSAAKPEVLEIAGQFKAKGWVFHAGAKLFVSKFLLRPDGELAEELADRGPCWILSFQKTPRGETYLVQREGKDSSVASDLRVFLNLTDHLLRGGWSWGFESRSIYDAVLRDSDSSSGALSRPYFSAQGGWGFQKASFDNNRSTIYSDTAQGQVHFYSTERIGRIGRCWNVAKHVIVYERTVVATEQFPESGYLNERAIVRKVEEFVELIQPRRMYPESGDDALPVAFFRGTAFKTRRIPVNGAWGTDLPHGWTIPLWREDENPQVYPRPQIDLLCQGCETDEMGVSEVAGECLNPQNLVFYTNTEPQYDERTDLWPPVEGIDYKDIAIDPPDEDPFHTNPTTPEENLPDDADVAPGLGDFTVLLAPTPKPVNLVSERAEQAMGAVVTSLVFMRSAPAMEGGDDAAKELLRMLGVFEAFDRKLAMFQRAAGAKEGLDLLAAEAKKAAEDFDKKVDEAQGLLGKLGSFDVSKVLKEQSHAQIERVRQRTKDLLGQLFGLSREKARTLEERSADTIRKWKDETKAELKTLELLLASAMGPVEGVISSVGGDVKSARDAINGLKSEIDQEFRKFAEMARRVDVTVEELVMRLESLNQTAAAKIDAASASLARISGPRLVAFSKHALEFFRQVKGDVKGAKDRLKRLLEAAGVKFEDVADEAQKELTPVLTKIDGILSDASNGLGEVGATIGVVGVRIQEFKSALAGKKIEIFKAIDAINDTSTPDPKAFLAAIDAIEGTAMAAVDHQLDQLKADTDAFIDAMVKRYGGNLSARFADLKKSAEDLKNKAQGTFEDFVNQGIADFRKSHPELGNFVDQVQDTVKKVTDTPLVRNGSETLRLLRACGKTPLVPQLRFNKDRLAYFFDDAKNAIQSSPVVALANRVGEDLKAMGVRLPTREFLDQVIPDELQNYDFSKLIPDFSGLRLDGLFRSLKFPQIPKDRMQIKHGFDRENRIAWLEAHVNIPLVGRTNVFDFTPLQMNLLNATFEAHASVRTGPDLRVDRTMRGVMTGDWELVIGGCKAVRFMRTQLKFDDRGNFDFDVDPARIEMDSVLQFLTDLCKTFSDPDSGCSLELVTEGGLPMGARFVMDLPMPPLSFGAFSVTSVRMGAQFGVQLSRREGKLDFAISAGFSLGRRISPFNLRVWILVGSGFIETAVVYYPNRGKLAARFSLGILAGVGLDFAAGPVQGGIYLQLGLMIEYSANNPGEGNGLSISICLQLRGDATIFGWVRVTLFLELRATYQSDGRMYGTGTLSLRIRICWCLTIKVSTGVSYTLKGGSGPNNGAVASLRAAEVPANYYDRFQ